MVLGIQQVPELTHTHTHARSSQPPIAAASAADRMFLETHMNKCSSQSCRNRCFRLEPSAVQTCTFLYLTHTYGLTPEQVVHLTQFLAYNNI